MNKSILYAVIGVLAVAVVIVGFGWYQDANTAHLDIKLGENGLSVDAN